MSRYKNARVKLSSFGRIAIEFTEPVSDVNSIVLCAVAKVGARTESAAIEHARSIRKAFRN